jgi:prefoldin beta subunit
MELEKKTQEKLKKLQEYEHQIQALAVQRQKLDSQGSEIQSAVKALSEPGEAFKIIGNVMVSAHKPELKKELEQQKAKLELRISSLQKQQDQLNAVAGALQKEVLKHMKGG